MKIKRYTGANTREVLTRIRNDLGPDAVILSNREIVGGVELMAAVDFDANALPSEHESVAPRPAETAQPQPRAAAPAPSLRPAPSRPPVGGEKARDVPAIAQDAMTKDALTKDALAKDALARLLRAQTAAAPVASAQDPDAPALRGVIDGLRDDLAELRRWMHTGGAPGAVPVPAKAAVSGLAAELQGLGFSGTRAETMAAGAGSAKEALERMLRDFEFPHEPVAADGVYALVGATGVGKTTTIAKLAARLVLRHGTGAVALVTTDTYRIGGVEQLRIYGRILGVPVAVARDGVELEQVLEEFADRRFVLIDTIGLSPRDARLGEQMQWLQDLGPRMTRLLLINGGMHAAFYARLWGLYRELPVSGCVLTKLDETPTFGGALEWLHERGLPVWFYTDGQRVPEDLHVTSAANLASLLLGHAAATATVTQASVARAAAAH